METEARVIVDPSFWSGQTKYFVPISYHNGETIVYYQNPKERREEDKRRQAREQERQRVLQEAQEKEQEKEEQQSRQSAVVNMEVDNWKITPNVSNPFIIQHHYHHESMRRGGNAMNGNTPAYSGVPKPPRRGRTQYSDNQLDVLEETFKQTQYPDAELREKTAQRIDVPASRVQVRKVVLKIFSLFIQTQSHYHSRLF